MMEIVGGRRVLMIIASEYAVSEEGRGGRLGDVLHKEVDGGKVVMNVGMGGGPCNAVVRYWRAILLQENAARMPSVSL